MINRLSSSFEPVVTTTLALSGIAASVLALCASFAASTASADVRLPKLVSSGMVLQRDMAVNVWGWADPGEAVRVSINKTELFTVANAAGEWTVTLPAMKAGGPFTVNVQGDNQITLQDVLVGDVWLASGQSNMELTLSRAEPAFADLVPKINNTQIRQFEVPDHFNFKAPQKDLAHGSWKTATQDNIRKFSAVAYFFADNIHQSEKVPVGIINASLGGSPVEAWLSEEVLANYSEPYAEAVKFRNDELIEDIKAKDKARANSWYGSIYQKDSGIKDGKFIWADPDFKAAGWQSTLIPSYWGVEDDSLKAPLSVVDSGEGSVWYRKTVHLTAEQIAAQGADSALLVMGTIVDADEIFVNGEKVGNTTYMYPPRRYKVDSKLLKAGKNSIVVRVVNNSGLGGFIPDKEYALHLKGSVLDLKGEWLFKRGSNMPALASQTFIRWKPMGLYNGLIAPLTPYAIKGVIWSQGESNAGRADTYVERFPALINDWRKKWGQGDFPFLYTQLSNYVSPGDPRDIRGNWPELRDAQLETLKVPNTAMAVTIDVGEWNDIHPLDKKTVGDRLALGAQKLAYGHNVEYSGPLYKSAKRKGSKVKIKFNHAKGLLAKGGELAGFELAGDDGQFVPAKAKVKGRTVIVWSDQVKKPKQVQYAWRNNPEHANLYNKAGLPASPFKATKL